MVTHSDEGSFWSVVKKGAEQAAKDEGVKLIWSPSNNDPQKQAQLIDAAVSQKVDGLAVSVPNADAIKGSLAKAKARRHPDHHAELGRRRAPSSSARSPTSARPRTIAGKAAGAKLKAAGAKKVLCVIHEQNNIGLQQRCQGVKEGFGGDVTNLQVKGTADIATTQTEIKSKLQADKSFDARHRAEPGHRRRRGDRGQGRRARTRRSRRSTSARTSSRTSRPARSCSRSTSSSTSRATCRSCS